MTEKTVLVCLGVNRRPVTFYPSEDTTVSDVDQLRTEILNKFSDIIKAGDTILIQVLNYTTINMFAETIYKCFCL